MKKIEVYTRGEQLENLERILTKHNCQGMTVFTVMGCGRQNGYVDDTNREEVSINLLPKICVITVVKDGELNSVLQDIREEVSTDHVGDGKVFVYDVLDAMRIRTGERGENAL